VAVKKLKLEPQPLIIPEGLYALPTGVILFQKTTGFIWANDFFEKSFGPATNARFMPQQGPHLIQEKPIHLNTFTMVGRHEGYAIQNAKNQKIPVEIKVNQFGDAKSETF